ncbi:MAG: recombinase family protein [Firmicutes bacterium]|nr:recombinase family protein [Bacillota bacterium]
MIFGYARVSTQDQNLNLQTDDLQKYGAERIFQEKITGTRKVRPELENMIQMLREGDTVVVWKLDRIGRSIKHLIDLIEEFKNRKVNFVSIKENIDTSTATGKLIFNIFASLAEFERDIIAERTRAGLTAARARGKKGGRPSKNKDKVELALKMYDSKQYTVNEIIEATSLSKTTFYRYLNQSMRLSREL